MGDLRFIQVGELAKGISENALPEAGTLSGRSLQLFFEDGSCTSLTFTSAHELRWEVRAGPAQGTRGEETYRATCFRDTVYFVDYLSSAQRATSVSLVLDLADGEATAVVGTLPAESEVQKSAYRLANEGADLTAVAVQFLLQPDRDLRAHLPQREAVHVAVPGG